MKKNKLVIKLVVATVAIGGLFFGGEYLARNVLEKQVIAEETKELSEEEQIAKEMEEFKRRQEEVDNMSVRKYYIEATEMNPETSKEEIVWKKAPEFVAAFEEKFGEDTADIKNKDLSNDQFHYLMALIDLHEYAENPILKRNEAADVEYAEEMSLELNVSDVMAMAPNEDTEKIVEEICQKAGVNPDGNIKELTPELILEINDKLFEYEQENHIHE